MKENIIQKMYRYWILVGLHQSKEGLENNFGLNGGNSQDFQRQLSYLRRQIILQYLKNAFLFPIWFVKILIPSFLIGETNVWTNLKLIFTQKEFRPLRLAIASWLIFTFLLVQGGVYIFRNASPTKAAVTTFAQSDWSGGVSGGAEGADRCDA